MHATAGRKIVAQILTHGSSNNASLDIINMLGIGSNGQCIMELVTSNDLIVLKINPIAEELTARHHLTYESCSMNNNVAKKKTALCSFRNKAVLMSFNSSKDL